MTFAGVNYWAILIAAVVAWLAGGVWYTTLGKPWMAAQGFTPETLAAAKERPGAYLPFIYSFVADLVIAWALAGLIGHMGQVTVKYGIITGALCWLGFVITTLGVNYSFGMRSPRLIAIDGAHWLLVLVLMGAIIGAIGA